MLEDTGVAAALILLLITGFPLAIASVENRPSVSTPMSVERSDESSVLAAALRIEFESIDICVGVSESTPVCRSAIERMSPKPPPPPPPPLLGALSAMELLCRHTELYLLGHDEHLRERTTQENGLTQKLTHAHVPTQ